MTKPNELIDALKVTDGNGNYQYVEGLTKREYFAAMAMQGILSNPNFIGKTRGLMHDIMMSADALIAELNKPEPPKETDNE